VVAGGTLLEHALLKMRPHCMQLLREVEMEHMPVGQYLKAEAEAEADLGSQEEVVRPL